MNDLNELRELLHRKADEVQPYRDVPARMIRRARRRMARTFAAGALVVAALAGGGLAGYRMLAAGPVVHPRPASPTPSVTPSTSPTPVGPLACTAASLQASMQMEGAAGSQFLTVTLTNAGTVPCDLQGRPSISVTDEGGGQLSVQTSERDATWQLAQQAAPPGWPVVTLRAGDQAIFVLRWTNECDTTGPTTFVVRLPDGSSLTLDHPGSPPGCLGPGQPSILEIGPFEPPTA
jgi:uncharacterized protein DUF4232